MKIFKNFTIALLLILTSTLAYSQEPATLTLEIKKTIKGAKQLNVNLDRQMKTKYWKEDYIKIVITVKSKDINPGTAVILAHGKRYNVKAFCVDGQNLEIVMPNVSTPLIINHKEIEEDISCEIYVPFTYTVSCPEAEKSMDIFNCDEVITVDI